MERILIRSSFTFQKINKLICVFINKENSTQNYWMKWKTKTVNALGVIHHSFINLAKIRKTRKMNTFIITVSDSENDYVFYPTKFLSCHFRRPLSCLGSLGPAQCSTVYMRAPLTRISIHEWEDWPNSEGSRNVWLDYSYQWFCTDSIPMWI